LNKIKCLNSKIQFIDKQDNINKMYFIRKKILFKFEKSKIIGGKTKLNLERNLLKDILGKLLLYLYLLQDLQVEIVRENREVI